MAYDDSKATPPERNGDEQGTWKSVGAVSQQLAGDLARRKDAAKAILCCLIEDDREAWLAASPTLSRKLTEQELASVAWAALRAMPGEAAFDTAKSALECGWEFLPPLDPEDKAEVLSTARMWAAGASQNELMAAAVVAVEGMAPRSRTSFAGWLKKKGLV
ncbi:hypothetical protein N6L27_03560 [Leisingera sp. SS27]|uniref:hypothetical protein n=1 Tax=Leisingera sp. SS27 TaxID=2979462 RepID=UPI00232D78B5|nr:hypothetical protein [Leisingera sp. SS27]MDC0657067.1 hypothetical protein [Leisingera sp. SS27]